MSTHRFQEELAERELGLAQEARLLAEGLQLRAIREQTDERQAIAELSDLEAEHRSNAARILDDPGRLAALRRAAEREQGVADDLRLMRDKVSEMRDGARERATDRLLASGGGHMAPADFEAFVKATARTVSLDQLDRDLADQEARHRATAHAVRVTHEPGPYEAGSPNSWFLDHAAAFEPQAAGAVERLRRHAIDVREEVRRGSEYGRMALRMRSEMLRREDAVENKRLVAHELRALGTGGGTTVSASGGGGAAFIPPAIVAAAWAPFLQRSPFLNACNLEPLPDYGMEVYLAAFTSDSAMAVQTEGSALAEADATATLLSGALSTVGGKVTVTQALFDRGGGPGSGFDRVLARQLGLDYARQLDIFAITTAIAAGGSITYGGNAGAFELATASGMTAVGFVDKLAQAKSTIRTTAGAQLEPGAVFFEPNRWEYIAGWGDAQGRPILLPAAGDGAARKYGDTGVEWGGLHVYCDPNIPAPTTGADQALVADLDEVYVWRTPEPTIDIIPQGAAGNLETVVRGYGYAACICRYASTVQAISGAGMAAITF